MQAWLDLQGETKYHRTMTARAFRENLKALESSSPRNPDPFSQLAAARSRALRAAIVDAGDLRLPFTVARIQARFLAKGAAELLRLVCRRTLDAARIRRRLRLQP